MATTSEDRRALSQTIRKLRARRLEELGEATEPRGRPDTPRAVRAVERETGIPPALTGRIVAALAGADHLGTLRKVDTEIDAAIQLYRRVAQILEQARDQVARTVNTAMVRAYWHIGHEAVEVEQAGERRAGYGEEILKRLSDPPRSPTDGGDDDP